MGREEALLQLVEEKQLGRVVLGFEIAIAKSFAEDSPPTKMTQSAIKERFDICVRIFRELRGDLKWGLERILDQLPVYLRCELDGKKWTPDTRTVWTPGDGA